MKKLLLLALLLAAPPFLAAQSTPDSPIRVHVLPVVNRSDQPQFDAVATTVTGTVSLTLRLLGNYEISQGEPEVPSPLPADPSGQEETLAALAEELEVENLVFGEVLPSAGEQLPRIRLAVYDRLSGEITVQEERTPHSLFGIFTVTDELTADVLSGFAGRRVAFGSVRITPEYGGTGEPPPYRVALDGEVLGANLRSVDSILTGSHRLTVTTEVLGGERVLLDEEISVEEGATREVALQLPNVDLVAEEQNRARRAAEERQRSAIRRLQAERRTYSSTLAAELYLTAEEFLDPQLIREEARENARVQAQFDLRRGQTMLSDRRWNEGMATHEAIAHLSRTFDQDDLFGYRDQIGFATSSYGEIQVQEERNPKALLPWLLFGAAFAVTIPTSESPFIEPGPPMAQYVPFLPVVFAGVSTAIWNASDWNYRPTRRLLRRYGRDGLQAVDRLRPWPKWELAAGITATMGDNSFRITPGPSGDAYGVGTVRFVQTSFSPALRLRYWSSPQTALGGELRVGKPLGEESMTTLSHSFGYELPSADDGRSFSSLFLSEIFLIAVDRSYTRTGRAILDLGLTLRALEVSVDGIDDEVPDILQGEAYEELLGGSTAFMAVAGVRTGFGLRFGRGELPPWEFALHYRLERAAFPNGILADQGPYYLNRFDASIRRSVFLGAAHNQARSSQDEPTSAEAGRARAEERWEPLPLWIYADPGGFLARGPRLGLEYQLTPRWSVGVHGRWAASLAMAEVMPVDATLERPEFAWPGASLRWYRRPQALSPEEMAAGWYAGGIVEYGSFDLPLITQFENEDEFVSNQGSLWFVLAEAGYRLPWGRSGFLDLGVQAGARLGEGYESERYRILADGSKETQTSTSMGAGTWLYPTLSMGTRLY